MRQDLQPLRTGQLCTRHLERRRSQKFDTILYLRAIQGHAGGNPVDPTLQDNEHVMILNDFLDYICHVRNSHDLHSIINSGLPARGKDTEKKRAVFFAAVDPLKTHLHAQREFDPTKPRVAVDNQNLKVHQNSVHWVNVRLGQRKRLTFHQTRSSANETLPSRCIGQVFFMKSEEILYDKV